MVWVLGRIRAALLIGELSEMPPKARMPLVSREVPNPALPPRSGFPIAGRATVANAANWELERGESIRLPRRSSPKPRRRKFLALSAGLAKLARTAATGPLT